MAKKITVSDGARSSSVDPLGGCALVGFARRACSSAAASARSAAVLPYSATSRSSSSSAGVGSSCKRSCSCSSSGFPAGRAMAPSSATWRRARARVRGPRGVPGSPWECGSPSGGAAPPFGSGSMRNARYQELPVTGSHKVWRVLRPLRPLRRRGPRANIPKASPACAWRCCSGDRQRTRPCRSASTTCVENRLPCAPGPRYSPTPPPCVIIQAVTIDVICQS